jgi:hypothetical protein
MQREEASAFSMRVEDLLNRVQYRRADNARDKEAIFRLRHESYTRGGYIKPNPTGCFTDPDDETPNAWLIGVFIDGVLASSIRLHIASRPEHFLPVARGFPDIIGPRLAAGDLIIDASRQTSRLEFARTYPFLTYITMRTVFIAEDHFDGDFVTAACRPEYQGAFRRLCGFVNWCAPRPYPPLAHKQALMGYDCRANHVVTRERYTFVPSTRALQRELFSRGSNIAEDPYYELTAGHRARLLDHTQHSTTCAA